MTVTQERPAAVANVAKRGDLVVVEQHHRDYVLHGESSEHDEFTVGVVTSVTRDGHVKMFRRAGSFDQGKDWRGQPDRGEAIPSSMVRSYVMSAKEIDVAGALATAACHVWVTDTAHEDHARAYESLAEVKAALKPHLFRNWTGMTGAQLSIAAAAWELTRRKAAPMLTEALKVAYDDRPKYRELSGAYHVAVTAANEAYRAAYAQAVAP
jgi:hypothetical protein